MNSRTTWTLVILAAGLFGFIFFFERHFPTASDAPMPGKVLPNLNVGAVTSIQVQPAGQLEIRADRTNDTWQLTKPMPYPAQAAGIENLLQALDKLTGQMHITAQELKDRPQADKEFGFAPPQLSLIIQQGDYRGQVLVGSKTALGDEIFVQVVGVEGIYVVDVGLLKFFPRTANDWRDTAWLDLKGLAFDHLAVTNGARVFELQRDATNKLWQISRPMQARADNPKIEALLQKLQHLRVSQFVSDDPRTNLEPFGLQPAELELALAQGTNTVLRLQIGRSPTNDTSQVYARRHGQNSVVLVASDQLNPWRGQSTDFRDRHLAVLKPGSVGVVEIRGADNFTLQLQPNETWRVLEPQSFAADVVLVRELLAELSGLEIAQVVKDVVTDLDFPSYGLAPPARQYILKSGANGSTNGATNTVIAQLDFGAEQDDKIFVRRADENSIDRNSVFAVKRADFRRLPAASWQLRERRIWNFTENDVTKLTIRQNGKVRELIRAGTNQWMLAPGSQGIIINDGGVEETVHRLGELTANAWVDRGDQNRARLGFSQDSYQISLEVKKGDETKQFSLEFGTASSKSPHAAVMLDGQKWIFEFPLLLYELVQLYLTIPASSP